MPTGCDARRRSRVQGIHHCSESVPFNIILTLNLHIHAPCLSLLPFLQQNEGLLIDRFTFHASAYTKQDNQSHEIPMTHGP